MPGSNGVPVAVHDVGAAADTWPTGYYTGKVSLSDVGVQAHGPLVE